MGPLHVWSHTTPQANSLPAPGGALPTPPPELCDQGVGRGWGPGSPRREHRSSVALGAPGLENGRAGTSPPRGDVSACHSPSVTAACSCHPHPAVNQFRPRSPPPPPSSIRQPLTPSAALRLHFSHPRQWLGKALAEGRGSQRPILQNSAALSSCPPPRLSLGCRARDGGGGAGNSPRVLPGSSPTPPFILPFFLSTVALQPQSHHPLPQLPLPAALTYHQTQLTS